MKEQFDKAKNFVKDHKEEIILGTIAVASIGFIAAATVWNKNETEVLDATEVSADTPVSDSISELTEE